MAPHLSYETDLHTQGYRAVAGLDEAGRGCWAGPVVAAAVVLPVTVFAQPALLQGIDDSKRLSAKQRTASYHHVLQLARGVGVGIVPAYCIDAFGIVPATRLAMMVALLMLPCPVDALLIDAVTLPLPALAQQVLLKGDTLSYSIAAASIVAKVTRDRLMTAAEQVYGGYGFALHKGYGTARHQTALRAAGPCALHRRTFRPVLRLAQDTPEADTPPVVY